ncbi:MAG: glycoside hydrolase family 2 TIM barrel-domain containing protein, partial [Lentisphaeria bacterium]
MVWRGVMHWALLAPLLAGGVCLGQGIEWSVESAGAQVADGQTTQAIRVTAANPSPAPVPVAVRIRVVDYFQTVLAEQKLETTLAAAGNRVVTLPVVTDHAGPYVKVVLSGTAGAAAVEDERLVFTEVLTGPRLRLSLNGAWRMADGVPDAPPPASAAWTACELPYRWLTWNGTHTRWFRREFTVPEAMRDKTLELQLSGVRFRAAVWCNGRRVKAADTDQMPFAADLTAVARIGQKNELLIGVTDWLSCVAPEQVPALKDVWSSAWLQGREIPGMPFIRPCTMGIGAAGISDPLYLVATPRATALERCLITPSVRQSTLAVRVVLNHRENTSRERQVRLRVCGRETTVPVTLKPGLNEVAVTLPVDLKTLTLWWPWKPHLYRLETELLQDGRVADRLDARFGFREFWADGPVFRINGVAIRPNAAAGIPFDFPGLANYDDGSRLRNWYRAKKFLRSFEKLNVNLVRYHTEPYPILMFDLADELGLMVVSEAFMSSLPGKLKMDDARLWANLREFYPRWVEREFNHPSLVIRSMENELGYHLPAADQPRSPWGYGDPVIQSITREMRDLGRLVKRQDPSRPIMYEGSGPLFYDVADICNLHYPGIPGGDGLYPVTGRWIAMPTDSYTAKSWQWDRKKPLYVGEYDSCFGEPKHFAPLLGNDAYVVGYLHAAHGAIWSFSIPGQRIDGMTTGVPWTILTFNDVGNELHAESNWKLGRFKELTTPVASFIHQYRECYFGGRTITRTVTTLNDTLASCPVAVRWRLETAEGGAVLRQGVFDFTLDPAGSRRTQWDLALPVVSRPTPCRLVVETQANGALSHTDQRTLVLYPDTLPAVATSARIGVLGLAAAVLAPMGVRAAELSPTNLDLSAVDVVVAAGTVGLKAHAAAIDRFLRAGGRLVLLERTTAPDFLPFALPLAPGQTPMVYADDTRPGATRTIPAPGSSMTMLHPLIPGHPLLKGL